MDRSWDLGSGARMKWRRISSIKLNFGYFALFSIVLREFQAKFAAVEHGLSLESLDLLTVDFAVSSSLEFLRFLYQLIFTSNIFLQALSTSISIF